MRDLKSSGAPGAGARPVRGAGLLPARGRSGWRRRRDRRARGRCRQRHGGDRRHGLFRVRGVSALPAHKRAGLIADRIVGLARDPAFKTEDVAIVESEGALALMGGELRVMMVSGADAALEGVSTRRSWRWWCRRGSARRSPAYRSARTREALLAGVWKAVVATLLLIAAIALRDRAAAAARCQDHGAGSSSNSGAQGRAAQAGPHRGCRPCGTDRAAHAAQPGSRRSRVPVHARRLRALSIDAMDPPAAGRLDRRSARDHGPRACSPRFRT